MTVLTEALDRILNWLHEQQRQRPELSHRYWCLGATTPIDTQFYPQLSSGLSRSEIAEITKDFPEQLPPEVIELYQWRNGAQSGITYLSDWLFNFGEGFGQQRAASFLDLQSAVSNYRSKRSNILADVNVDNLLNTRYDNNSMKFFDAMECVEGYMVINQNRKSYPIVFWDFKGGGDIVYSKYASLTDMMVTIAECYENACTVDDRGRLIENKDKSWEIWRKYNASYWVDLSLRNIDLIQNKLLPRICDERLSTTVISELADTLRFS
jgi:hypothetical protein